MLSQVQLLDVIPDVLYLSDSEGRVLEGNIALVTLLGYPDLDALLENLQTLPALPF